MYYWCKRKFKSRGQKVGALAGWRMLESAGLAEDVENKVQRGTDKVRVHVSESR